MSLKLIYSAKSYSSQKNKSTKSRDKAKSGGTLFFENAHSHIVDNLSYLSPIFLVKPNCLFESTIFKRNLANNLQKLVSKNYTRDESKNVVVEKSKN